MIREAIATGDTVELAIAAGCRELSVETHEAQFDIIDMPVKKTLGLFGGNPAKVRVYIELSPAISSVNYLKSVLSAMGAPPVDIAVEEIEGGAVLSLNGEGLGFLIGRHGETLDALQYLSGLVANHIDNNYYRITLNMGNYREKRERTLQALAKRMASKCLKYGRNLKLEPMNPYERRIIHTAIQEMEAVKSWSEGAELSRHVVIGPEAGERPFTPRGDHPRGGNRSQGNYNNNRNGNNRGYNNRGGDYRGGGNRDRRDNPSNRTSSPNFSTPQEPRSKSVTETTTGSLYGRIDVKKTEE